MEVEEKNRHLARKESTTTPPAEEISSPDSTHGQNREETIKQNLLQVSTSIISLHNPK
jgi:hypothetical protein